MHPPFGFALFYLRSVAPREPYRDRSPAHRSQPVTTGQIYWGAVPFVCIQVIMVGLAIAFPEMIMHYKSGASTVDPATIEITIPPLAAKTPTVSAERPISARRPICDNRLTWRQPPGSEPAADIRLASAAQKAEGPGVTLRALPFDRCVRRLQQLLALLAHHEGVEGAFGDLEPEILLGAERHHGVMHLLEAALVAVISA